MNRRHLHSRLIYRQPAPLHDEDRAPHGTGIMLALMAMAVLWAATFLWAAQHS